MRNYEYEERLYSTGSEDLDMLLERAFCEGYEYAQREFVFAEKVANIGAAAKKYQPEMKKKAMNAFTKAGRNISSFGRKAATNLEKMPKAKLGAGAIGAAVGAGILASGAKKLAKKRDDKLRRQGWVDARLGAQRIANY